jgi:nucleoid DNA-binding protein
MIFPWRESSGKKVEFKRAGGGKSGFYHHERNHQGAGNRRLKPGPEVSRRSGPMACRQRLGCPSLDHHGPCRSDTTMSTKLDLATKIAAQTGIEQQAVKQVVQMTLDGIIDVLAGEGRLELRNFGVFKVRDRKGRMGRDPRTDIQGQRLSMWPPRRLGPPEQQVHPRLVGQFADFGSHVQVTGSLTKTTRRFNEMRLLHTGRVDT